MSDTRIGVPFLVAMTMLLNCSVASMRPSVRSSSSDLPCSTVPPGISMFSPTTASRTCSIDSPYAVQLLDVHDDVDLAGPAAAQIHLADAVHRLDRALHLLVGDLRQRPQAHRVRRHDDRHDRIGIGIDLRDDRRQQLRTARAPSRSATFSRTSLAASLMSRSRTNLIVMFALPSVMRPDVISSMPGDAAERFFDRLDDRRRHLVRAGAGQRSSDVDGRRIGLREQIDAEVAEREDPEHHERHDEHRREHGPADAEL